MQIDGEWRPGFGRIVARDFAVLARLTDSRNSDSQEDDPLRDYFLVGIRGLGTWGAGWFIDRRYEHFKKFADREDIQLLLEVHYWDNRVIEVLDVSDKPQEYFDNEIDSHVLQSYIDDKGLTLDGKGDY